MPLNSLPPQALREWREAVRLESLRRAELDPEVAAGVSTAAAVGLKQAG